MSEDILVRGDGTGKELKHINLHRAIIEIEDLNIHARQLLLQIKGNEESKEPCDSEIKMSHPSLSGLLENGSEIIQQTIQENHKILDQIKEVLF